MAWSDAARAAAAAARKMHAKPAVSVGKGYSAPRGAMARMIKAERNKNVMHGGLVSAHGTLRQALRVRNARARSAAAGALRADAMFSGKRK